MSSRKAQIEINQDTLINYVYGKISIEEENYIEDILFENDNYTIAVDKLLSFVIRQKVKIKELKALFRVHCVNDLDELEEKIESMLFQYTQQKVTKSAPQDYERYKINQQGIIALQLFDILAFVRKHQLSYQRICQVVLCCWMFVTFSNLESLPNRSFVSSTPTIQLVEYQTEVAPSFLLLATPWQG